MIKITHLNYPMHICGEPLVLAMLEIIEAILPSYPNKGQGKM